MDRGQKNEDGGESQDILSWREAKTIDFNMDITRIKIGAKAKKFWV